MCGCDCGPEQDCVYRIGDQEFYVGVVWHTCTGCEAPPTVQLSRDPYLIQAAKEIGRKVVPLRLPEEAPEIQGRTDEFIVGDDERDKLLQAALFHVGEAHVHDSEECPGWFTTRSRPRRRPDIGDDWPPSGVLA